MKTLGEMIERNARFYTDGEALVFGNRRVTHGQMAERARRFSNALYRQGLRRQDRVAVLAMNCAEYYETYRACEWAGFLLATVNFRLAPAEIAHIVKDAAPKALVFEAQYAALVGRLGLVNYWRSSGRLPDICDGLGSPSFCVQRKGST